MFINKKMCCCFLPLVIRIMPIWCRCYWSVVTRTLFAIKMDGSELSLNYRIFISCIYVNMFFPTEFVLESNCEYVITWKVIGWIECSTGEFRWVVASEHWSCGSSFATMEWKVFRTTSASTVVWLSVLKVLSSKMSALKSVIKSRWLHLFSH